jgi:hypothetical protein
LRHNGHNPARLRMSVDDRPNGATDVRLNGAT